MEFDRQPPIRSKIVTARHKTEFVNYVAHILMRVSVSCPDYGARDGIQPGIDSSLFQSPGPKVIPPDREIEPMPKFDGPERSADPATTPLPVAPAKRPVPPATV